MPDDAMMGVLVACPRGILTNIFLSTKQSRTMTTLTSFVMRDEMHQAH